MSFIFGGQQPLEKLTEGCKYSDFSCWSAGYQSEGNWPGLHQNEGAREGDGSALRPPQSCLQPHLLLSGSPSGKWFFLWKAIVCICILLVITRRTPFASVSTDPSCTAGLLFDIGSAIEAIDGFSLGVTSLGCVRVCLNCLYLALWGLCCWTVLRIDCICNFRATVFQRGHLQRVARFSLSFWRISMAPSGQESWHVSWGKSMPMSRR